MRAGVSRFEPVTAHTFSSGSFLFAPETRTSTVRPASMTGEVRLMRAL